MYFRYTKTQAYTKTVQEISLYKIRAEKSGKVKQRQTETWPRQPHWVTSAQEHVEPEEDELEEQLISRAKRTQERTDRRRKRGGGTERILTRKEQGEREREGWEERRVRPCDHVTR